MEILADSPIKISENKKNGLFAWILWHFYEMPKTWFSIWKNYLWFGLYYFSIPFLLATLFLPWRKYAWRYPKGFDVGGFLSTFASNLFSRLIGAFIRVVLVIVGIALEIFIFVAGIVLILLWYLLPFLLLFLLLFLIVPYGA